MTSTKTILDVTEKTANDHLLSIVGNHKNRVHLTKQLVNAINEIADVIALNTVQRVRADIKGLGQLIVLEDHKGIPFLSFEGSRRDYYCFSRTEHSDDFTGFYISEPSREAYLYFANHITEILKQIADLNDHQTSKVQQAFQNLRDQINGSLADASEGE